MHLFIFYMSVCVSLSLFYVKINLFAANKTSVCLGSRTQCKTKHTRSRSISKNNNHFLKFISFNCCIWLSLSVGCVCASPRDPLLLLVRLASALYFLCTFSHFFCQQPTKTKSFFTFVCTSTTNYNVVVVIGESVWPLICLKRIDSSFKL